MYKEDLIGKILYEATHEQLLKRYVPNPETGHSIKISSALTYPPDHPSHKRALQVLSKAKDPSPDDPVKVKATKPSKSERKKKRVKPSKEKPISVKKEKVPSTPKVSNKNARSHKPKSNSYGVSKECAEFLKSKGYVGLNAYPQSFVTPQQIQFNPALEDSNKNSVWICKFPVKLPNGKDAFKTAYTRGFMKKSQIKKYKKISKIKESDITNLEEKTKKLLGSKDKEVSDCACVLRIILKTGLRVGSVDEADSGNIGVRTLKADNIKVEGNKVKLNFIGKSYQENSAEFDDPEVASYLKNLLKGKQDKDRIFGCSYGQVGQIMKKINPKGINPKDLRTYKATEYAKKLLESEFAAPPPIPDDPKLVKKAVKEKLKAVFEKVALLLNNNPGMAKGSYVHPVVITDFLSNLGLEPKMVGYKHMTLENRNVFGSLKFILKESTKYNFTTMDQMFEKYRNYGERENISDISEEDMYNCEEFLIPDWYYRDDWLLFKK